MERPEPERIQRTWSQLSHTPTKAGVKRAALLALEGSLTSVKNMLIRNMHITDIPRAQMEKLTTIATERVWIDNMTPTSQLNCILACVKCPWLWLDDMSLSEENTRALVTAMRERVERVLLDEITLDIEQLTKYDGQGRCRELGVCGDTRTRHEDRLRRWAADTGWTTENHGVWLWMERK